MADPAPVLIRAIFELPPEQAIAYLDAKGYRTSVDWTDTFNEEHDSSFTVAKIAKIDLLRQIHVSILDAMAAGKTFAMWKAELQPELEAAGWWGSRIINPELTGTSAPVTIGPRRLRTIFDVNIRMARSAALWERVQSQKRDLPFLRYSAVLDRRTRPAHRAWHGTILPVDHPWWRSHFPPCGWGCRCTAIQLSQDSIDARGWTVATEPPPGDLVPFFRKSTGQTIQVPAGIDPGFGYNPGIARMQALADKVASSLIEAKRAGLAIDDDAALADILASFGEVKPDAAMLATLRSLIAAGQVTELAAALAQLLGVVA